MHRLFVGVVLILVSNLAPRSLSAFCGPDYLISQGLGSLILFLNGERKPVAIGRETKVPATDTDSGSVAMFALRFIDEKRPRSNNSPNSETVTTVTFTQAQQEVRRRFGNGVTHLNTGNLRVRDGDLAISVLDGSIYTVIGAQGQRAADSDGYYVRPSGLVGPIRPTGPSSIDSQNWPFLPEAARISLIVAGGGSPRGYGVGVGNGYGRRGDPTRAYGVGVGNGQGRRTYYLPSNVLLPAQFFLPTNRR